MTINTSSEKSASKDMVASPRFVQRDNNLDGVVLGTSKEIGQYVARFLELQGGDYGD